MATRGTLLVNPATGAIAAPTTATTFRNANGLQIGLNIQAWSASLDSAATHISWSGSIPTFASEIIATSSITTTTGNVIVPSGDVITGGGVFADTLSVDAITATGDVVLTGTFDFSGATGTLGYGQGGTNATTQAGARTNFGGVRYGFADGTAVLAATPEFIGQSLLAADGYWGIARGTTAGATNPFAVVTNGVTYFLQDTYFNEKSINVSKSVTLGFDVATGDSMLIRSNTHGGDMPVQIQPRNTDAFSGIDARSVDDLKGFTYGYGDSGLGAGYPDTCILESFDIDVGGSARPITVSLCDDRAAGVFYRYHRLEFHTNGDIEFYKLVSGSPYGTGGSAMKITAAGAVTIPATATVGTATLSSGSKLTVAGELHTNGSTSALRYYSQNSDGGFYQWYSDTLSNSYLQSSANGTVLTYNATNNQFRAYSFLSTGKTGYYTGAGGAQTQGTSKSTAVTLNKSCGEITMHNATLNANTTVAFTLNNSLITAADTIVIHRKSGGTASSYNVWIDSVAAGSCVICVQNITAGNLGEAVVLSFAIVAGVAS